MLAGVFFSPMPYMLKLPKRVNRFYDGACNVDTTMQQVSSQEPPKITDIYPVLLRAGYVVQVSLKGVGLANARIVTNNHHLIVNSTRSTDSQVVF